MTSSGPTPPHVYLREVPTTKVTTVWHKGTSYKVILHLPTPLGHDSPVVYDRDAINKIHELAKSLIDTNPIGKGQQLTSSFNLDEHLNPTDIKVNGHEVTDIAIKKIFQSTISKVFKRVDTQDLVSTSSSARIIPGANVGITNPNNSCFMNAALQALCQDSEVKGWILEQIAQIKDNTKNPTLEPIIRGSLDANQIQNTPYFKALRKTINYPKTLAPQDLDQLFQHSLVHIYANMTLGQAASYAEMLLEKWLLQKEVLSSSEAKLLRICLIKLMNCHTIATAGTPIKLKHALLSDYTLVNNQLVHSSTALVDVSINFNVIGESDSFADKFLDGLATLSKSLNPFATSCTQTRRAFQPGQLTNEAALLDTKVDEYHPTLFTVNYDETKKGFDLTQHEAFAGKYDKTWSNYKHDEDTIYSEVRRGDTIDESFSYTFGALPEKLMMSIQNAVDESSPSKRLAPITFTDQQNLELILPSRKKGEHLVNYKLTSFTVHVGASKNGGHYINITRVAQTDGSEIWIKQSDSHPQEELTFQQVQSYFKGHSTDTPALLVFNKCPLPPFLDTEYHPVKSEALPFPNTDPEQYSSNLQALFPKPGAKLTVNLDSTADLISSTQPDDEAIFQLYLDVRRNLVININGARFGKETFKSENQAEGLNKLTQFLTSQLQGVSPTVKNRILQSLHQGLQTAPVLIKFLIFQAGYDNPNLPIKEYIKEVLKLNNPSNLSVADYELLYYRDSHTDETLYQLTGEGDNWQLRVPYIIGIKDPQTGLITTYNIQTYIDDIQTGKGHFEIIRLDQPFNGTWM